MRSLLRAALGWPRRNEPLPDVLREAESSVQKNSFYVPGPSTQEGFRECPWDNDLVGAAPATLAVHAQRTVEIQTLGLDRRFAKFGAIEPKNFKLIQ